ncbi:MAG: sigma factor, partial [Fimbriimonadales bacterium]
MRFAFQTEEGWRAWLSRQARGYTRSADTAEDWVQETLLAFWQRFGRLPWEQVCDEAECQRRGRWCRQK